PPGSAALRDRNDRLALDHHPRRRRGRGRARDPDRHLPELPHHRDRGPAGAQGLMISFEGIERWIWLIPLLPALGALANGLTWVNGRRISNRAIGWIACGSVFLSFLLSAASVWPLAYMPGEPAHLTRQLCTWSASQT